jgi:hypothetical protein
MKEALKLFDRAYDRAARLYPVGETPDLSEEEDQILLKVIRAYEARKAAALEEFQQYMKERYPEIPDHDVKLIFKEQCRQDKMPYSGYKPKKKKR